MMRWACACLLVGGVAYADDTTDADRSAAAETSVNPLPYVEKLQLEPSYQWAHGSTHYRAQFQFEAVLPFQGLLLPGLDVDDVWSVSRLQVIAESLQNDSGTASGFENLSFVDLAAHRFGDLSLGVGFGTVFPMATSSELGPAKWQIGPALGFNLDAAHWLTIAALAQALWSVAGSTDAAHLGYATVQPFVTFHPLPGFLVKSDETMTIYWAGGSSTFPVNLGVGYAFSKHFVGALKCAVTAAGSDRGAIKGVIELNFLP